MSNTRIIDTMAALVENAKRFATVYVAISEALLAEGVPEERARAAAQSTAMTAALMPELPVEDIRDGWELP